MEPKGACRAERCDGAIAWLQDTGQQQCSIKQSHVHKSRGTVIPLAAGMVVRWQPGSRTQFVHVRTAAQRLGQQCGGSRDSNTTVLWQQDSWGSGDVAAAPTVWWHFGSRLTARCCTGTTAQKPASSHCFIPSEPQCWPLNWYLKEEIFLGLCYATLICK